MRVSRTFILERPARKSGGDRYMQAPEEGAQSISQQIYIDQQTSRNAGKPRQVLKITVESIED